MTEAFEPGRITAKPDLEGIRTLSFMQLYGLPDDTEVWEGVHIHEGQPYQVVVLEDGSLAKHNLNIQPEF